MGEMEEDMGIGQGGSYLKKWNSTSTIFLIVFPSRLNELAKNWGLSIAKNILVLSL